MTIAAVTITYDRLDLTKKMVESFYKNTNVDYHLFIDNGSTDGTQEWIADKYDHIFLDKNYGIAYALAVAVKNLLDYDFILKLDNDIEIVTPDIVNKMLGFYWGTNRRFVASPTDVLLDKRFAPRSRGKARINGYNVEYVSHTGGAFQIIPTEIAGKLCEEWTHLKQGDFAIGKFYSNNNYRPVYLRDFEMRHIGLNQSTPSEKYIM